MRRSNASPRSADGSLHFGEQTSFEFLTHVADLTECGATRCKAQVSKKFTYAQHNDATEVIAEWRKFVSCNAILGLLESKRFRGMVDAERAAMKLNRRFLTLVVALSSAMTCSAAVTIFEAAGATPAAITATRDAFRAGIGGGTVAGANGDFGGLRREINWDGVPDAAADPNPLPGTFFNTNSPRGAVFSTPGTGLLVSANAGLATPTLFGFPNDLQTFSPQRLFTAVNSNTTDVTFFVPGTATVATTSAFGLIFVDVEVGGSTHLDFFDASNSLIFSHDALVAGNQGLTFLGGIVTSGPLISRVRITSGSNTLVANGQLGSPTSDFVVMDDFIYATPTAPGGPSSVPDTGSVLILFAGAMLGLAAVRRRIASRAV